jgi:hypothetical protein
MAERKGVDRAVSVVFDCCGHGLLGIVLVTLNHLFGKIPFVLRTSSNLGAIITAPSGSSARWVLERSFDLPLFI